MEHPGAPAQSRQGLPLPEFLAVDFFPSFLFFFGSVYTFPAQRHIYTTIYIFLTLISQPPFYFIGSALQLQRHRPNLAIESHRRLRP